jgi:hypothetical protein
MYVALLELSIEEYFSTVILLVNRIDLVQECDATEAK